MIVDELLVANGREALSQIQRAILIGSCGNETYQKIADNNGYAHDTVRHLASELWQVLGDLAGEKIAKSTVREILTKYQQSREVVDWGESVDVSQFYGRQTELATLQTWMVADCCRVISIVGLGGMGKTSLSVKLMETVKGTFTGDKTTQPQANGFNCYIWRSLKQSPPLSVLLDDILPILTRGEVQDSSLDLLFQQLRSQRCLLVLDNFESLLEGDGSYRQSVADYRRLLVRFCDESHRSCLVITSRLNPSDLIGKEGDRLPIRSLKLQGLSGHSAEKILRDKGLAATEVMSRKLANYLGGNPLVLKMTASKIKSIFAGDISRFLSQGTTVFGDLWQLLEEQFDLLGDLEKSILYWLAIEREEIFPDRILEKLVLPIPLWMLVEKLDLLGQKSMIERSNRGLTEQPMVMEYITERLVRQIVKEIIKGEFSLLKSHAIIEAKNNDDLREVQTQLILQPIVERLLEHFLEPQYLAIHLQEIIESFRDLSPSQTGYAMGNILNILCFLGTNLNGWNLSKLSIRQAYLAKTTLVGTNLTDSQLQQTVFAETFGGIVGVTYSPDGRFLATSDTKGDIQIWDGNTSQQLVRCCGHKHWTWSLQFSPDSRYLASASDDYTVKLWDVETGECLYTYKGHEDSVNAIAFSPDGETLASGSQDRTIRLWRVMAAGYGSSEDPAIITIAAHDRRIWTIAFHPDGKTIASGSEDLQISIWEAATGNRLHSWRAHENWVRCLTFSPDGSTLASASFDRTVKIWEVANWKCRHTLRKHRQPVTTLAFSPTGEYLASGGSDRAIELWDVKDGNCVRTFLGHTSRIWGIAYHPNGKYIASGADDYATKIWQVSSGRCKKTIVGHTTAALSLAVHPRGGYLVSGHEDRTLRLWDVSTGKLIQSTKEHQNRVWGVAFSPDGKYIATASADSTVKLWSYRIRTGDSIPVLEYLSTYQGHASWVWTVVFSPDGKTIASGSYDRTIRLWDVRTGECQRTLTGYGNSIASIDFSPDGKTIVAGEFDGSIAIWDLVSNSLEEITAHEKSTWQVCFSPDGKYLLSGSFDRTIKLWCPNTRTCLRTFTGHSDFVKCVSFTPDGNRWISGSWDGLVKIWDLATGEEIETIVAHDSLIYALAMMILPAEADRPQTILFSASMDESIKSWDLDKPTSLGTWRVDRPYEGTILTGVRGLNPAQISSSIALGAIV